MINLVIVGEKPSIYNISEDIPFVGANCFETLTRWIKRWDVDYYISFNSETERDLREIELLADNGFKVIALGKFASVRLRDHGIEHVTMPHPSSRNLQNNDKEYIFRKLDESCTYLRWTNVKVSNG